MQTFKQIPYQNYIVKMILKVVTKVQPKEPVISLEAISPIKIQTKRTYTLRQSQLLA